MTQARELEHRGIAQDLDARAAAGRRHGLSAPRGGGRCRGGSKAAARSKEPLPYIGQLLFSVHVSVTTATGCIENKGCACEVKPGSKINVKQKRDMEVHERQKGSTDNKIKA